MSFERFRGLSRREWLRLASAGISGASVSGWFGALAQQAAQAATPGAKPKACILLWMDGGPSHIDTFDPKPDAGEEVSGGLRAIPTSVPGIHINESLPQFAKVMEHAAILRGMSTGEADHGRARIYMHTGHKPGQGGVDYPGLGSIVSSELGAADFPLPNFVATGTPAPKYDFFTSPGYLGARHQGLAHADAAQGLQNLAPLTGSANFGRRTTLLDSLEERFARTYQNPAAEAHRATLAGAIRLMRSDKCQAFDISREPAASRAAYGDSNFGRGCLLARRLVEVGVPFVEVYLSSWDSHEKRSADSVKTMLPQLDQGMAALVRDLKQHGLLDSTLVIWMGEFGRSPRINQVGGRDHYAKAWSTVLAGGGIRGGQVIGRTSRDGGTVEDRPISAADFMASVCQTLGIDHQRQHATPGGRPIRFVDAGARPIPELAT